MGTPTTARNADFGDNSEFGGEPRNLWTLQKALLHAQLSEILSHKNERFLSGDRTRYEMGGPMDTVLGAAWPLLLEEEQQKPWNGDLK
jgi:hypothetical protein